MGDFFSPRAVSLNKAVVFFSCWWISCPVLVVGTPERVSWNSLVERRWIGDAGMWCIIRTISDHEGGFF